MMTMEILKGATLAPYLVIKLMLAPPRRHSSLARSDLRTCSRILSSVSRFATKLSSVRRRRRVHRILTIAKSVAQGSFLIRLMQEVLFT